MKSFLKWAGGKRQLLRKIEEKMPEIFNDYYEPFVGGGTVFFELITSRSTLNDINQELMNAYIQVRDNPDYLIAELERHTTQHSEEYYYEMRKVFNDRKLRKLSLSYIDAGLMIYLNKTGWNGMYRENKKGLFNIPSGKKENPLIFTRENIYECSSKLKNVTILNGDFYAAVKDAKKDDFVFIDSPYDNTFTNYQKDGFTKEDHIRVADMFKELDAKGVKCLLTNSDTEFIRDLYKGYNMVVVKVRRMINSDSTNRKGVELIITNY